MRITKEDRINKYLCVLGQKKSGDKIASFFKSLNIKGIRRSKTSCPIKRYLRLYTNISGLRVNSSEVIFGPHHRRCVPLNKPCRIFIRKFDKGMYPELEKE